MVAEPSVFGVFDGLPCERTDCHMEENGPNTSTLMGWKKVYNRAGERVDDGDPNWHYSPFYCLTCNKRWTRCTRRDEIKWTTEVRTEA